MTGSIKNFFRSSRSPLLAMVVVASETTWISLCFAALTNTASHFSMDVPYLALAVPAVIVVGIARAARELPGGIALRLGTAAAATVLTVAVGAGILASFSLPSEMVAVAFHPWAVTRRIPSATTSIAWFAVSLVAVRAIWLGLVQSSLRQAGRSATVTALVFLALFIVLAKNADPRLHTATRGAEILFVAAFVAIPSVFHLMRTRERAAEGRTRPNEASQGIWRMILIGPLIIVIGLGFLAGATIGAFGSTIGMLARDVGHGIASGFLGIVRGFLFLLVHLFLGVASAIGWIVRLFDRHPVPKGVSKHPVTTTTVAHLGGTPHVPPVAALVLAVIIFGGAIFMIARYRPRPPQRAKVITPAQQMGSLFTWGHLFSLIWQWIARSMRSLLARLAFRRGAGATDTAPPLTGVRAEYARILSAAARAGCGRSTTETAREFALRVGGRLESEEPLLSELTSFYEAVRYGNQELGTAEAARVVTSAVAVTFAFDSLAAAAAGAQELVSESVRERKTRTSTR